MPKQAPGGHQMAQTSEVVFSGDRVANNLRAFLRVA